MEIVDAALGLAGLHAGRVYRLWVCAVAPYLDVQDALVHVGVLRPERRVGHHLAPTVAAVPLLRIEEYVRVLVGAQVFQRQHLQLADGAVVVPCHLPGEAAQLRDALGRALDDLRGRRALAVEGPALAQPPLGHHVVTAHVVDESQHHRAQGRHLAAQPLHVLRVNVAVSPPYPLAAAFLLLRRDDYLVNRRIDGGEGQELAVVSSSFHRARPCSRPPGRRRCSLSGCPPPACTRTRRRAVRPAA